MNRAPQIWTNTDKEGGGTNYLPIVDENGHLKVMPYGWDGTNAVALKTNSAGELLITQLNMASSGYAADITTTAQKIGLAATTPDITIPAGTQSVIIQNDDADNKIYIGGSNITSAGANAGHALNSQGDSWGFNNIGASFTIYVIGSAASTQLRVLYS